MTRAIDLARGGSTAEEISINTGISGDEAEACDFTAHQKEFS